MDDLVIRGATVGDGRDPTDGHDVFVTLRASSRRLTLQAVTKIRR